MLLKIEPQALFQIDPQTLLKVDLQFYSNGAHNCL